MDLLPLPSTLDRRNSLDSLRFGYFASRKGLCSLHFLQSVDPSNWKSCSSSVCDAEKQNYQSSRRAVTWKGRREEKDDADLVVCNEMTDSIRSYTVQINKQLIDTSDTNAEQCQLFLNTVERRWWTLLIPQFYSSEEEEENIVWSSDWSSDKRIRSNGDEDGDEDGATLNWLIDWIHACSEILINRSEQRRNVVMEEFCSFPHPQSDLKGNARPSPRPTMIM